MFETGKYGRYLSRIFMLADFVVLNLMFLSVCLLNPEIAVLHRRLTWLLMNVAFIPAVQWLRPIGVERAMQMERVMRAALLASLTHLIVFLALLYVMGDDEMPWHVLMEFYMMDCASFLLWRVVSQWLLKRYRSRGGNIRKVVIVGCRTTAERLYEEMMHDSGYGYDVGGFYDVYCPPDFKYKEKYRGNVDDLERSLAGGSVDEVFYTLSGEDGHMVRRLLGLCDRNMMRFNFVPQMSSYLARNLQPENIGAVPVLGVRSNPLDNPLNTFIKRTFDIVFSGAFLLVSPLIFIPVAIAVKLSSPGPVFFRQLRTGYKGTEFYCWKFRTMKVNKESDTMQATRHDPRTTRVGEFLRRTSIDELPQFINVFLGDMSVVGPRPHMLKHTEDYSRLLEKYMVRHFIKPGITGWAQVRGYRGQTDELWQMQRRIEHDIWYMEHWSFLFDCKIIISTFVGMFQKDDNAF